MQPRQARKTLPAQFQLDFCVLRPTLVVSSSPAIFLAVLLRCRSVTLGPALSLVCSAQVPPETEPRPGSVPQPEAELPSCTFVAIKYF